MGRHLRCKTQVCLGIAAGKSLPTGVHGRCWATQLLRPPGPAAAPGCWGIFWQPCRRRRGGGGCAGEEINDRRRANLGVSEEPSVWALLGLLNEILIFKRGRRRQLTELALLLQMSPNSTTSCVLQALIVAALLVSDTWIWYRNPPESLTLLEDTHRGLRICSLITSIMGLNSASTCSWYLMSTVVLASLAALNSHRDHPVCIKY